MENKFYSTFKKIIRECNYTNTYKMAWAKALVEISLEDKSETEYVTITLEDMAKKMIKYYWNQTIFFDLVQGSNLIERPYLLQYVKELIGSYYRYIGKNKPDRYEKIEEIFNGKLHPVYTLYLSKFIKILKKDVSWRFLNLDQRVCTEIYQYEINDDKLVIKKENLNILKEDSQDLFDLINYRWGLILETFNSSPRINRKVKIIDEQEVRRNSLDKFKRFLDLENPNKICFICGNEIDSREVSIDHVIPWSYLYSDDIWNLVYVHKSCNSSKSNVIPDEKTIEKLKTRNVTLLDRMVKSNIGGKDQNILRLAIDKDYVNKFWIACKS